MKPAQIRPGASLVFSGQPGLEAPQGAEKLTVRLSRVSIEGELPELSAEGEALKARLLGRSIAASEIFAAARDLEAAYARQGFVLVRVVLPAQKLNNGGPLRLVVVDGFIESIDTSRVPDAVHDRVTAYLSSLVGRHRLRLGELERKLLLAGDLPGVYLRSTLRPGAASGATVLVVEAQHHYVTGSIAFDNTLSASLGSTETSVGLDANSVLKQGESFYVRAAGHLGGDGSNGVGGFFGSYPRDRTLGAGFSLPIGDDGLTATVEETGSWTTPQSNIGPQAVTQFDKFSVRLRYPWIRSRALSLATEVYFDAEHEQDGFLVTGNVLPVSIDRLRVFRAAADLLWQTPFGGTIAARTIASFGIDGLGARSAADAAAAGLPLTRAGSDAGFQKLELSLNYSQALAEHFNIVLLARGQTSFNQAMARSEQIGIASQTELSTFDAGTLGGDSGWVTRAEVSSPWRFPVNELPVAVAPYVFAATGTLYNVRPTVLERQTLVVSSVGGGVRFGAAIDPHYTGASFSI